jgi:N-methylhydantoinase A/oxoprolinase/acetone carboxylase beta subunit
MPIGGKASGSGAPISRGSRSVRLARGEDGRREVPAYDGADLLPGFALSGPALIDCSDTTIWVPEGMRAAVNAEGTFVMEVL